MQVSSGTSHVRQIRRSHSVCTLIFPGQFGISYDDIGRQSSQNLFDAQLDVRDLLRGQRSISWVIVSTGVFTSFLFEPMFDVVDLGRGTITALGSWENRVTTTSPADIGRVVGYSYGETPICHICANTPTHSLCRLPSLYSCLRRSTGLCTPTEQKTHAWFVADELS